MKRSLPYLLVCLGCAAQGPRVVESAEHAGHAEHGAAAAISLETLSAGAVELEALGDHHRTVTTKSPDAQRFFDQGLRLLYGFNHDEAARSFARAAALDPSCAACFWGASLVLGPNYNVPMLPDRAAAAWDALQRAQRAAPGASPVEQALIGALAKRYAGAAPLDPAAMQPFNQAYAEAMRKVAQTYPDDLDVQTLHAEALMDLNPWRLWSLDGKPAAETLEIVAALERVLKASPSHPGANHYYIHAVEPSPEPGKALPSAERLADLMPGAGHVVHMPAHIFQRVGRYADASSHNAKAAEVDVDYVKRAKPFGYYPVYVGHNYGFLSYSASMEGRRAASLKAAVESAAVLPKEVVCLMPGMDFFTAIPVFARVRFGVWDELLAEPRPEPKYEVLTGLWLHGRAMALASTGKLDEAKQNLAELDALAARIPAEVVADQASARDLLDVAARVVRARIAEKERKPDALALWAEAVAHADKLPYSEPADWFYPVRHYQGAALLAAGKARDAEAVYREDLRRNPHNGWALFGLAQSLEKQKRSGDAKRVREEFRAAWKNADIQLTASAY